MWENKTVSDDDMMRGRKSRGKEEAHLAALFDYLETGSEKVQEADEQEKSK